MRKVKPSELKPNPNNPRQIKDENFKKLVQSLKDFPEMATVRPVVVNTEMVILGGNMRFRAMKEAGWKEIPIEVVDWTEEKQREFIIKDNVSGGEWDWDTLANEWNTEEMEAWGLEIPELDKDENAQYTKKIEPPIYEPKNEKPTISELFDDSKYQELINAIELIKGIPEDEKEFLTKAAQRHIVFNYEKIADFYAHSNQEIQSLMEDSALVIIDIKKAIENGYVKLSSDLELAFQGEINE
jgi:hypothetical protein